MPGAIVLLGACGESSGNRQDIVRARLNEDATMKLPLQVWHAAVSLFLMRLGTPLLQKSFQLATATRLKHLAHPSPKVLFLPRAVAVPVDTKFQADRRFCPNG